MEKLAIVVLISGRGSNLQAIIDAADPLVDIRAVISNRPHAQGLHIATQAGIPCEIIDHTQFANRDTFDTALQNCIDHYQAQLVVLAGFMRILTPDFIQHYAGRLINIHPSLLPAFKGLHTHRQALQAGVTEHGATVHFVTPELDSGAPILQGRVPVYPDDTEEQLAQRVLDIEHQIYPQVIHWFAEQRLYLQAQTAYLDNKPIN
ncbi:phosphoribosylglycinamide formyltransferase [Beggiatoa leptomitoformis]|uniref:Phosphoribosylglycinamide formyltransferase n=2 Tax=Beggiatoa leptomitoformis TaxID=288004 RepID=A0A2N9YHU7_9GAMM|nr:phosphoribosylglycinamide formyltransferase [Beggiatoa leptomitoformis]ALG67686.1 phosphoribosylglycinamide formyltransferase [Beggiatoa leptomitoformis]AUI70077.1 phosphoribosylglycinamide formyltransferase [Beggiatoa leptomitoformis]